MLPSIAVSQGLWQENSSDRIRARHCSWMVSELQTGWADNHGEVSVQNILCRLAGGCRTRCLWSTVSFWFAHLSLKVIQLVCRRSRAVKRLLLSSLSIESVGLLGYCAWFCSQFSLLSWLRQLYSVVPSFVSSLSLSFCPDSVISNAMPLSVNKRYLV